MTVKTAEMAEYGHFRFKSCYPQLVLRRFMNCHGASIFVSIYAGLRTFDTFIISHFISRLTVIFRASDSQNDSQKLRQKPFNRF